MSTRKKKNCVVFGFFVCEALAFGAGSEKNEVLCIAFVVRDVRCHFSIYGSIAFRIYGLRTQKYLELKFNSQIIWIENERKKKKTRRRKTMKIANKIQQLPTFSRVLNFAFDLSDPK